MLAYPCVVDSACPPTRQGALRQAAAMVLLLWGCMLLASPAQAALRCPDGLVENGDLAIEVVDACGEPDFIDRRQAHGIEPYSTVPGEEQWTYNFGPHQLLFTLLLRAGRVQAITSHGYGFNPPLALECQPQAIEAGMSKYALLARCGQPAQRSAAFVLRPLQLGGYYAQDTLVRVYREVWIYNFGGSRLLRQVTLEDGQVVDVDTGGYGFD